MKLPGGMRRVPRPPWPILGLLLVAQWVALAAFVLVVRHNGWLFYQGGDETFFYTSSWVLSTGHIPEASIGYAWSFLLMPIAALAGANFLVALPALVLLQVAVFQPIALYCVYGIAERFGGPRLGYIAAALWVAAPYAAIPLWDGSYHSKYVEDLLPQAFGLTGLGDYPSMVCMLVAALLCLRALDGAGRFDAILAGIATGFAVGLKPSNALFLLGPLLAFASARRLRNGAEFSVALLPSLVTIALWKYRGLGHLPIVTPAPHAVALGHGSVGVASAPGAIELHRYLNLDWSRLRENYVTLRNLFTGLIVWQALPVLGFAGAARRSTPKALLLGGWLAAFILVKGTSDQASVDGGTLLRLFMPGFPPILILSALVPLFAEEGRRRFAPRGDRGAGRIGVRITAAVAILFTVVPFVCVATFPLLRGRTSVKYFDENVLVPVAGFSVSARSTGTGQTLSWRAPPSRRVDVFYHVFRSRPIASAPDPSRPPGRSGIRCLQQPRSSYTGAADCRLEMTPLGTTTATSFFDRPPRGRWIYRVGMAANWRNDQTDGDVFLLSEASNTVRRR